MQMKLQYDVRVLLQHSLYFIAGVCSLHMRQYMLHFLLQHLFYFILHVQTALRTVDVSMHIAAVLHTAQNSSDSLPSYLVLSTITAQMLSNDMSFEVSRTALG